MTDIMESLTLNVRVDANDKRRFEEFCNSVGMNVSTAVNMFIKAVLREQKLPFEVRANTFDENVYEKLREAEKRYTKEEVFKSINDIIGQGIHV